MPTLRLHTDAPGMVCIGIAGATRRRVGCARTMRSRLLVAVLALSRWDGAAADSLAQRLEALRDCARVAAEGFRPIAEDRKLRFLGKVAKETGNCRGGKNTRAQGDALGGLANLLGHGR